MAWSKMEERMIVQACMFTEVTAAHWLGQSWDSLLKGSFSCWLGTKHHHPTHPITGSLQWLVSKEFDRMPTILLIRSSALSVSYCIKQGILWFTFQDTLSCIKRKAECAAAYFAWSTVFSNVAKEKQVIIYFTHLSYPLCISQQMEGHPGQQVVPAAVTIATAKCCQQINMWMAYQPWTAKNLVCNHKTYYQVAHTLEIINCLINKKSQSCIERQSCKTFKATIYQKSTSKGLM